jgi:hypothetical protein
VKNTRATLMPKNIYNNISMLLFYWWENSCPGFIMKQQGRDGAKERWL